MIEPVWTPPLADASKKDTAVKSARACDGPSAIHSAELLAATAAPETVVMSYVTVDLTPTTWPYVAMKRVKIAALKNQLSKHLRAVERGAEIEVTDRDRPIARIVPVREPSPRIRIFPAKRPFSDVRDQRLRPARWAKAAMELLLEERRKR